MAEKIAPAFRFRTEFDAYWPNYDHAPETCFRFVQRGLPDIDIAARMCRYKRVAVQAGGHAGFWPRRLSQIFRKVYSFECEPVLFECAIRNLKRWRVENVDLRPFGLGAAIGTALLTPHRSAGSWFIDQENVNPDATPIRLTTIDALNLAACDALYLDVEGYEVPAMIGAAKTIEQFRPMIHVEELPESRDAIRRHLAALGYRRVAETHKDVIYRPQERNLWSL